MPEIEATPYWLDGNFAPVQEEITSFALEVEGALPPELCGLYARNGANPRDGHSGHWFLGEVPRLSAVLYALRALSAP